MLAQNCLLACKCASVQLRNALSTQDIAVIVARCHWQLVLSCMRFNLVPLLSFCHLHLCSGSYNGNGNGRANTGSNNGDIPGPSAAAALICNYVTEEECSLSAQAPLRSMAQKELSCHAGNNNGGYNTGSNNGEILGLGGV